MISESLFRCLCINSSKSLQYVSAINTSFHCMTNFRSFAETNNVGSIYRMCAFVPTSINLRKIPINCIPRLTFYSSCVTSLTRPVYGICEICECASWKFMRRNSFSKLTSFSHFLSKLLRKWLKLVNFVPILLRICSLQSWFLFG